MFLVSKVPITILDRRVPSEVPSWWFYLCTFFPHFLFTHLFIETNYITMKTFDLKCWACFLILQDLSHPLHLWFGRFLRLSCDLCVLCTGTVDGWSAITSDLTTVFSVSARVEHKVLISKLALELTTFYPSLLMLCEE